MKLLRKQFTIRLPTSVATQNNQGAALWMFESPETPGTHQWWFATRNWKDRNLGTESNSNGGLDPGSWLPTMLWLRGLDQLNEFRKS